MSGEIRRDGVPAKIVESVDAGSKDLRFQVADFAGVKRLTNAIGRGNGIAVDEGNVKTSGVAEGTHGLVQ